MTRVKPLLNNICISGRQIQVFGVLLILLISMPVFATHNSNRKSKESRGAKKVEAQEKQPEQQDAPVAKPEKPAAKTDKTDLQKKKQLEIDLLKRIDQSPRGSKSDNNRKVKPMTLADAEQMALRNDPMVSSIKAQRDSLEQKAQAAYSWPDPKLKIGVMNVPKSTLDFEQEPMTQKVIGVTQMFPPLGAVGAKRDQIMAMSEATEFAYQNRKLETLRAIRQHWLMVHKFYQTRKLIQKSLDIFSQLKKITQLQYRAGRGKQQDVLRAQLEESLLMDRKAAIIAEYEKAIAQLRKTLNISLFERNLEMAFPAIKNPPPETEIKQNLDRHPWLLIGETNVKAARNGVQFANAQFNPAWSLDISYGQRGTLQNGTELDDFVSAMFMFDLPFFRGGRQSRQLQSSQSDLSAAKYNLDDRRREIKRRLEDSLAAYRRADERLELYSTLLLPQAEQNTESSLSAYQSGVNTFSVLVRARLTEMNSRIQFIKLKVDRAFAKIELLYLAGVQ